jgi:hypothetical protein
VATIFGQAVSGQEWARKMFTEYEHDFGTVARAAKEEHVFEMTNLYKETIHIAGVRASCGCASPSIVKDTLKTWETGGILVKFNTRSFMGQRAATITVTIDQPYYAEVQLAIRGNIRGDIVFDPGVVDFGSAEQGEDAYQTVNVNYAGRSDWRIIDVRSANTNLEVELNETQRFSGRVGYQLKVRLKPEADLGYFNDQMILVTNDGNARQIPVRVMGNVLSALQISPASLSLGIVNPGDTVTRNLVVRGKRPFRITKVKVDNESFDVTPSNEQKSLHLIPVRFKASEKLGKIAEKIEIETDLETGAVGSCTATATVLSSRQTSDADKRSTPE